MFDQPIIRVCLVLGSLITATYILRRVRLAKVQIEDTIFWLLFSGIRLSQLDSKVRILTQRVALNEEKIEREKLDL